jgi:hypothetical protein
MPRKKFCYSYCLHRVYHLKHNQTSSRTTVKKWKQKQVHHRVTDSPNHSRDTRVKVTLVARSLLAPVAGKLCRSENGVSYSRAERAFVLEHYFAWKSFAAVLEACGNAYPNKKVPSKATIHRVVTKIRKHRKCLRQETSPGSDSVGT